MFSEKKMNTRPVALLTHTHRDMKETEREREREIRQCPSFQAAAIFWRLINVNEKQEHVFQCHCCEGLMTVTDSVVPLKGSQRHTDTNKLYSCHDDHPLSHPALYYHSLLSCIRIRAIGSRSGRRERSRKNQKPAASFQICRDHSKLLKFEGYCMWCEK